MVHLGQTLKKGDGALMESLEFTCLSALSTRILSCCIHESIFPKNCNAF